LDSEEREFAVRRILGDAEFLDMQARQLEIGRAEPDRVARARWMAAALRKAAGLVAPTGEDGLPEVAQ
jgi:hypothetical protein